MRPLVLIWILLQGAPAKERPEDLIRSLGDLDIEVRLRAAVRLSRRLPEVADLLRSHLESPDREVAARCRDLLSKFKPQPKPMTWLLQGKIVFVHGTQKMVAIDLRAPDGLAMNQQLEAWRGDAFLGEVRVTDIQLWGSWAALEDEELIQILQKGDLVRWGPDD